MAVLASWPAAGRAQPAGAEIRIITVFAVASLKNALDTIAADYQPNTGNKVTISYAASSALAKQIEQAAPADAFISADLDWMDYLADKALIKQGTRRNLLGNRLVLIAPAKSTLELTIEPGFALAKAIGSGRIAKGEVNSVPAGKYGKAALKKLGVWTDVEPKVAHTENVRAALVAKEETALGIVYRRDAAAEPSVRIVGTFPENIASTDHLPASRDGGQPERRRHRVYRSAGRA